MGMNPQRITETMEAEGIRRALTRSRKPLSDLTNTSRNISSSSSCSSKLSVANDKPSRAPVTTAKAPIIDLDNASSNPSTPPPSTVPAPSSPKRSTHHGIVDVDLEAHEPISVVYSRKSASRKRKDKGKAVAFAFSSAPTMKISDSRQQRNIVEVASPLKAKALTVPCRKKQRAVLSKQDMSKDPQLDDYIQDQKEYFKSVDDFELLVEEVESVDQLD